MALATSCPRCQTSFRVVPDQLKIRRGLVRCGSCQHVFSGIDSLRYIDEPPPPASPRDRPAVSATEIASLIDAETARHAASRSGAADAMAQASAAPLFQQTDTAEPSPPFDALASGANPLTDDRADPVGPTASGLPPLADPGGDPLTHTGEASLVDLSQVGSTPPDEMPADATALSDEPGPASVAPVFEPPAFDPTPFGFAQGDEPAGLVADVAVTDVAAARQEPANDTRADDLVATRLEIDPPYPEPADTVIVIDAPADRDGEFVDAWPEPAEPAEPAEAADRPGEADGVDPVPIMAADPATEWYDPGDAIERAAALERDELLRKRPLDTPMASHADALVDIAAAANDHDLAPELPGRGAPRGAVLAGSALTGAIDSSAVIAPDLASVDRPPEPDRAPAADGSPIDAPLSPTAAWASGPDAATPVTDLPLAESLLTRSGADAPDPKADPDAVDFFAAPSSARGFTSRTIAFATMACVVLSVALVVQVALAARDWLAAWVPALEPALSAVSGLVGLRVQAPRSLAALTLESFELQAGSAPGVLNMSALLRNRAHHIVHWPGMELTLTDGSGVVIVRKVLQPADYLGRGLPAAGVPAGVEQLLTVSLEGPDLQPTGYNVKLFYP